MPELPEVETICSCLRDDITGETIKEVWIKKGSRLLRDTVGPRALKKALTGRKIKALFRRGKYIIMDLEGGGALIIHLGMTGAVYLVDKSDKSPEHTHLRFELPGKSLLLVDPRTFGKVVFCKAGEERANVVLSRLAPDPFDESFTKEALLDRLRGRTLPLKAALLDQQLAVSGLGNIYVDECCFRAGIRPTRYAGSLDAEEAGRLHRAIREVLEEAIRCKGTTIRDYRWAENSSGEFLEKLKVYGKEGQQCSCGRTIEKTRVRDRSTHFCPGCQK